MTLSTDAALLGVCSNATPTEIKVAYREKAMTTHPDKGGDAESFAELSAAYDRLLDAATKREAHCSECNNTGVVRFGSGFNTAWQACPRCRLTRKP
jgi:DnaJ-class molecular chaperone